MLRKSIIQADVRLRATVSPTHTSDAACEVQRSGIPICSVLCLEQHWSQSACFHKHHLGLSTLSASQTRSRLRDLFTKMAQTCLPVKASIRITQSLPTATQRCTQLGIFSVLFSGAERSCPCGVTIQKLSFYSCAT